MQTESTNFSNNSIPKDIITQIFLYLDLKSLGKCLLVCKNFHNILELDLWKHLILRDYPYFLCTEPLPDSELDFPTKASQIITNYETEAEATSVFQNPFKRLSQEEKDTIHQRISTLSYPKEFYLRCHSLPNISGFWVGDYGGHGFELIRIYHKGYKAYAQKLTGDPNIPAGKVTWKVTFGEDGLRGKGELHLAESGYINSRWSTAYIDIGEKDCIQIDWFIQDSFGFWYKLTFGNVKAGMKDFVGPDFEERITLINLESEEEEDEE